MSPLKNANTQKLVLGALALFALAISFHQFLWHTDSPYIFTRDDNLTEHLSLLKWYANNIASFRIPRMYWSHGTGWDPFLSWQLGLFYPPYLIANFFSELFQMPLAIFEISFLLHQAILIAVVLAWGPTQITHRILLCFVLLFLPAPFLLGISWHLYGVCHIWWLAVCLWLYQQNLNDRPFATMRSKCILFILILLFYAVSHPQMFMWGVIFWGLWLLIQYPLKVCFQQCSIITLCLLPIVPTLLLGKWVSLDVSAINLRAMDPNLVLSRAVPVSVPLLGSFLGGLGGILELPIHKNTAPDASMAGLYFQPAFWFCLFIGLRKRRWALVIASFLLMAVLGIKTFPFLSVFFVGPFSGFRWTFKLLIFTGPLFLMWLFPLLSQTETRKLLPYIYGSIGCVALIVCWQSRHIDGLYETYKSNHHAGSLIEDMEACFNEAGVAEGSRIAYVDAYTPSHEHPAFLPLLLSNTISYLRRDSLHLYEPLESDSQAAAHLHLRSFHGIKDAPKAYKRNKSEFTEHVRQLGGTHLVALKAEHLNPGPVSFCTHAQHNRLYFQTIPEKRNGPYPQMLKSDTTRTMTQDTNGILRVSDSSIPPPQLNTNMSVHWEKTPTGWIGYPNPIHPMWATSMFLLFLLMLFSFWQLGRYLKQALEPSHTD